jgi:hypothetical protein
MKQTTTPKYIRAKDAAARPPWTWLPRVPDAVLKCLFPFYRFGKQNRLFKVDELDQAMAAYRVSPTSEALS